MGKDRNGRQTIWVYAIVLFTSAFIVLLLTAYSQIKFNKNIDEYKNQLSSESREKKDFQLNLNEVIEANKKITGELETVKDELAKANSMAEENKKSMEQRENILSGKLEQYEQLIIAQNEYFKGNIVESAKILYNQKNNNLLEGQAKDRYLDLVEKTFKEAAYQLYHKGYNKYANKSYDQAIESLTEAHGMAPDEFFSDDCLYFIAYSHYRQGDPVGAAEYFGEVVKQYTESNYNKDAQAMLKLLK